MSPFLSLGKFWSAAAALLPITLCDEAPPGWDERDLTANDTARDRYPFWSGFVDGENSPRREVVFAPIDSFVKDGHHYVRNDGHAPPIGAASAYIFILKAQYGHVLRTTVREDDFTVPNALARLRIQGRYIRPNVTERQSALLIQVALETGDATGRSLRHEAVRIGLLHPVASPAPHLRYAHKFPFDPTLT